MAGSNNFASLILNRGTEEQQVVTAPAFSLTKLLQTAALVLTPLVSLLVKYLADVKFSTWQVTVLISAVLAFLAFTASADVLARALATSADKLAQAVKDRSSEIVPLDPPRNARRAMPGPDKQVQIVAVRAGTGHFLALQESSLLWVPQSEVYTASG